MRCRVLKGTRFALPALTSADAISLLAPESTIIQPLQDSLAFNRDEKAKLNHDPPSFERRKA